MRKGWLLVVATLCAVGSAHAASPGGNAPHDASTTVTFNFVSPVSTGITCTPTASSFAVPVAAGTVLANCTVAPSTWAGAFAVSGAVGIVSAGSGVNYTIQVGTSPYTAVGSVTETVTATP